MALLSVKRFLTQLEEEAAYRRVISMLLEAVATHALNLDGDACRSFRERIGEVRLAMTSETTVEELLGDAGAAVQAIGDYARSEERRVGKEGRTRWAPDHLKKKAKISACWSQVESNGDRSIGWAPLSPRC